MAEIYDIDGLKGLATELDQLVETLPIDQAMSKDEARQLMALGHALGGVASNLRLVAVRQLLAETAPALAQVRAATSNARTVLKRIAAISQVISLVGDVVVLAQTVALQKWPLVGPALAGVQKSVTAIKG
jgi:hypothetical protein